jgi:hypothetical protein
MRPHQPGSIHQERPDQDQSRAHATNEAKTRNKKNEHRNKSETPSKRNHPKKTAKTNSTYSRTTHPGTTHPRTTHPGTKPTRSPQSPQKHLEVDQPTRSPHPTPDLERPKPSPSSSSCRDAGRSLRAGSGGGRTPRTAPRGGTGRAGTATRRRDLPASRHELATRTRAKTPEDRCPKSYRGTTVRLIRYMSNKQTSVVPTMT